MCVHSFSGFFLSVEGFAMQDKEEKIDVYYVIKPIIYFARFCGLWPHTIKVN